ncbi:MAG: hypothetical protein MJ219_00660 [Mycoplasmoidaceae bacterium]|nr:hypothetical protein [Mycoplasmoidaceae bacterium]
MKKLHILIPSLIATTTIPLVGLVGCNKTNINVDDYKIDEDKFDEIVGMESVDYLQSEFEIKSTIADHQYQHTHLENYYYEMSPTIDHSIKTTDEIGTKETYEEEYV